MRINFLSFKKKLDEHELKQASNISKELISKKIKYEKLEEMDLKLLDEIKSTRDSNKIKELEELRNLKSKLKKEIEQDDLFLQTIKAKTDLMLEDLSPKLEKQKTLNRINTINKTNLIEKDLKNNIFNEIKDEFNGLVSYYKQNCINDNETNTLLIIDILTNYIDTISKENVALKVAIDTSKKFLNLLKKKLCNLSNNQLNEIFKEYLELLTNRQLNNEAISNLFDL